MIPIGDRFESESLAGDIKMYADASSLTITGVVNGETFTGSQCSCSLMRSYSSRPKCSC